MRAFFRWLVKIISTVLIISLLIVFFPYISRLAAKLMPDESGAAIKASAILSEKLTNSSRLETLRVDSDGVINYEIQAAFIGTVASINVAYRYEASFGIELQKVKMQVNGSEITFYLPETEVLLDTLRPDEVYRDDFWYPGFSDQDYENLLEGERQKCRDRYLSGEYKEQVEQANIEAFEKIIASWLSSVQGQLTFRYESLASLAE